MKKVYMYHDREKAIRKDFCIFISIIVADIIISIFSHNIGLIICVLAPSLLGLLIVGGHLIRRYQSYLELDETSILLQEKIFGKTRILYTQLYLLYRLKNKYYIRLKNSKLYIVDLKIVSQKSREEIEKNLAMINETYGYCGQLDGKELLFINKAHR